MVSIDSNDQCCRVADIAAISSVSPALGLLRGARLMIRLLIFSAQ
jgi:hypothetical protein